MIDLMQKKFHDAEYDGLVLKIPKFLIEINNLQPIIDRFTKEYTESVTRSALYEDHRKNLFELTNVSEKRVIVDERKSKEKEYREKIYKRESDLLNGNIYELTWETKKDSGMYEHITFPKSGNMYDYFDVCTNKLNFKKDKLEVIIKEFNEIRFDIDELSKFFHINGFVNGSISLDTIGDAIDHIKLGDLKFYSTSQYSIGISFEVLMLKKYVRKKNGIYFSTYRLGRNSDGYCYHDFNTPTQLNGYTRKGMELVKES